MSFIVNFFVLVITVSSVLFGMDWLSAPMSPMQPGKPAIQTANRPAPIKAAAKPAPAVAQAVPAPVVAPPPPAEPPAAVAVTPAPAPSPAPVAIETPAEIPLIAEEPAVAATPPRCDVNACTAAYRSFTELDCTYQPSNGPRRLCTRGEVPKVAADPATASNARADTCNVNACAAAYGSFDASDCTYKPFDGPRRACTR